MKMSLNSNPAALKKIFIKEGWFINTKLGQIGPQ